MSASASPSANDAFQIHDAYYDHRDADQDINCQFPIDRLRELAHSGDIGSLKHLQENVREVKQGFEFGVDIQGWNDYIVGDILEFYVSQRVNR